ncbi:hypothetical protein GPL01_04825 [Parabacteroides merdae]|uniref:hypothetical protein n=1 Tax=Parabacteroides merdae TaxID=46503 RepID=UPI001C01D63A|nr:hypothetical protein [Parabacteroides merdae]MBT9638199.1 hypothetical protein [Parabacteroides merdae]
MAIRSKGIVTVNNGDVDLNEFKESLYDLSDGEYGFLIFDKEKNKTLPQLKYLNGVVLKRISEELPGHPGISALYRYFEELYAPILKDEIDGETYEYFDLKSAKSSEMNEVIEKIIHHAKTKWNIEIITRDELKLPSALEPYADAYASQWKDYSRKI